MTIDKLVQELAVLRADLESAQNDVKDAQEALEATLEHDHLKRTQDTVIIIKERIATAEMRVRDAAVAMYDDTENKHPHQAVSIAVTKTARYDLGKVLEWCKENARIFIKESLDKKPFDKAARQGIIAPELVTIEEIPTARISSDLSEYIS